MGVEDDGGVDEESVSGVALVLPVPGVKSLLQLAGAEVAQILPGVEIGEVVVYIYKYPNINTQSGDEGKL